MQNLEIKLHDIKPLVEIQEYSFYYFIALVGTIIILLVIVIYFLIKWYKNKNRFNVRQEHFKLLSEIDMQDSKLAAYAITFYGLTFKNDSEEHTLAYEKLQDTLQNYKYKKYVSNFDEETKKYLDTYLGMINV